MTGRWGPHPGFLSIQSNSFLFSLEGGQLSQKQPLARLTLSALAARNVPGALEIGENQATTLGLEDRIHRCKRLFFNQL